MGTAERGRGDFRQAKVLDLAFSADSLVFVERVSETKHSRDNIQQECLLL